MSPTEHRLRPLMASALKGDGAAYRVLLTELSGILRRYFLARLPASTADAEDLVQETLIALHSSRDLYDPAQPLMAWVFAIARYKLADRLRRRSRRESRNDPLDETLPAASDAPAAEARMDVMALLRRLPDGQRTPILMTKLEGLSVEEAAARTGMSVSAVKVAVHRGLRRLASLVGAA